MDLKSKEYIEGPCNCLTRLLSIHNVKECKELKVSTQPLHDGDAFSSDSHWNLQKVADLETRELVKCPRVGLTLKRYQNDLEYSIKRQFWMADYRFLTHPELCKK
jgi:hypothetical protein